MKLKKSNTLVITIIATLFSFNLLADDIIHPFTKFIGSYHAHSEPELSSSNLTYCNFQKFLNFNSFKITLVNGVYTADITYRFDSTIVHNPTQLREYEFIDESLKIRNYSTLYGDEKNARFEIVNQYRNIYDNTIWTMTNKKDNIVHLQLQFTEYVGNVTNSFCSYGIDLVKE